MDLQGGPTFEDLSIDDELTQLQRLVRYSSSSIALQRLVHVKVGCSKCDAIKRSNDPVFDDPRGTVCAGVPPAML